MSENITLRMIFEDQRQEFETQLGKHRLPDEWEAINTFVSQFIDNLLDDEGQFRRSLTPSEDYLLQAAMPMLKSGQQAGLPSGDAHGTEADKERGTTVLTRQTSTMQSIIGSAGGALLGKLLLGGWGAVLLSPVGAVAAALLTSDKEASAEVDTSLYVRAVEDICDSVDNLMATYRAQIRQLRHHYEQQEKPLFENEHRVLLTGLQSLAGYRRTATAQGPEETQMLCKQIDNLMELLANYNLGLADYDGSNSEWFDIVHSAHTQQPKQAFPAVVKEGRAVLPGRVFLPETEAPAPAENKVEDITNKENQQQ